jgi:hypothetical protein
VRLKVEMTLNAATALRFKETAERLANLDLGDDGLLAATVLLRIAQSYEREANIASQSSSVEPLNSSNNDDA